MAEFMFGVEPVMDEHPVGWPYLIRRDRLVEPDDCPMHIAVGIQRFADALLIHRRTALARPH